MIGKAVGLLALVIAASAGANEYLTDVTSEVYQTAGSAHDVAVRGQRCIAEHLISGDGPVILNSDLDNGTIVARNSTEYGALPRWRIRSTFTFEAKQGRFRITQTNLQRFIDGAIGGAAWYPVLKSWGSGWKGAEQAFAKSASAVAACVVAGDKENW